MAKYTASLVAQNTSVFICNIDKPRHANDWFANVLVTGTFGGGTVTFGYTLDNGVTIVPTFMDGTATATTATSASAFNLRAGSGNNNSDKVQLWAFILAATNPSITINVFDNR